MSKQSGKQTKGRLKRSVRTGIAAGGFITAVLVVMLVCYILKIDMQTMAGVVAVLLVILVGIPLFIFASSENNDAEDEHETCKPIMDDYEKSHNAKKLIEDYREWTEGDHSSYSRVHFSAQVIDALQDAKEYEEALAILNEVGGIKMKARERYDYENYRDAVKPELLEGIEKEAKRAEERARNKNLRKK